MPPFKDGAKYEKGWTGEVVESMWKAGHGQRVAVVDASYNVPRANREIQWAGDKTDQALEAIAQVVPIEGDVIIMRSDDGKITAAGRALEETAFDLLQQGHLDDRSRILWNGRTSEIHRSSSNKINPREPEEGFYEMANSPEADTIFIRTSDRLPYACVTFVLGHSQIEG